MAKNATLVGEELVTVILTLREAIAAYDELSQKGDPGQAERVKRLKRAKLLTRLEAAL